jgi:hypothetical protein
MPGEFMFIPKCREIKTAEFDQQTDREKRVLGDHNKESSTSVNKDDKEVTD